MLYNIQGWCVMLLYTVNSFGTMESLELTFTVGCSQLIVLHLCISLNFSLNDFNVYKFLILSFW